MQQLQGKQSKWPTWMRISLFIVALLILIVGATIWALNSLNSLPALLTTVFGALATIFTFLSLIPIMFPQKSSEPVLPPQMSSAVPPINIYNVLPSPQSVLTSSAPTSTVPTSSSTAPSSPNVLTLRALPLPTDSQSIQQRETVVKDIYALLLEPHTAAVVLTGIGGIGSCVTSCRKLTCSCL